MSMRDHLRGGQPRPGVGSPPSTKKILALAAILVILLAAGVALYVKGQSSLVSIHQTTLCPIDRPPSELIVLLLDMSDDFSERQRLKVQNEVNRLKASIARFGLVEAYAVDRLAQRVPRPELHLCNPGTGVDLSRLYQNPDLARKKWDGFVHQLDAELERLMKTPASATSPIFEAVQATALRTFNRPDYEGVPKRLVIVSDLLQNVPGRLSMYQKIPLFEEFQSSPYFAQVRSDLKGVAVTLLYLVRPHAPQKWPAHRAFWEKYFLAQGATVELLEPVYGTP